VRTILELGCGTGNDAARLAGEGYEVTAVDLSGWQQVQLIPVPVPHRKTGEPFKHVWRGIARR
jgi:SAM-dependent methyltransferase